MPDDQVSTTSTAVQGPAVPSHTDTETSEAKESLQPPRPSTSLDSDVEAQTNDLKVEEPAAADPYLHGIKLVTVFIALALSIFLIILDQTILIPAIPIIAGHFDAIDRVGWVSSSYFLTQCSTILLWGQALARFEQKIPLLISISIFELGSLIAAVSQNFTTFIAGRAVAGVGGAAIMVAAMTVSARVIELKSRPIFFGMFGVMFVLGSALGPIIGGSFTSHATWRWCFYINIPIGGLAAVAIALIIPRIPAPAVPEKPPHLALRSLRKWFGDRPSLGQTGFISRLTALDWIGSFIVLGGVVSLTLALIDGGAHGWKTTTVIAGLTMAGVAVILLALWEVLVMKEDGMIPLRVARFRSVWGASFVGMMRMVNSLCIMTYIPTLLQATRHQSALKSAVSTQVVWIERRALPYASSMAVLALVGSIVVQKSGRFKWALVLGGAVSAVGAGLLYTVNENTSYAKIAGFQVIAALGAGLIQMNAVLAAQAEVDMRGLPNDIPQASALVSLVQLLGASIGGSLGGAILDSGIRQYGASLPSDILNKVLQSVDEVWILTGAQRATAIHAYSKGMANVFILGIVSGGLSFLFALICRDLNIKGKKFKH